MKKFSLIALTFALLMGVFSLTAFAAGNDPRTGANAGPNGSRFCNPGPGSSAFNGPHAGIPVANNFLAKLKLTPEQQQKMLEIRQNLAKDAQPLRFEIQKNQLQLKQLWAENPLNEEAIAALDQKIVFAQVKLINMSREMFKQMNSVLTPEQQQKVQKWLAGLKARMRFHGMQRKPFRNQQVNPGGSEQKQ